MYQAMATYSHLFRKYTSRARSTHRPGESEAFLALVFRWAHMRQPQVRTRAFSADDIHSPHTLPPNELLLTHLTSFLNATQQDLETRLAETQKHNLSLMEEIEGQRKEIDLLIKGVENVVGDLEGSVAALNTTEGVGEMARVETV